MAIQLENRTIETDEEGYLLNPDAWDECVAQAIAAAEGIELNEIHWGLINYFRTFFEDHMRHPTMHELVLTLGRHHGKPFEEAKKYREFLYELFPKGPVPTLCRLAGLPKPVGEVEE
ncbi:MAG: TusE/DsrC/DsvC family sulfur relay protein [Gammaproteobacteria bacterium]